MFIKLFYLDNPSQPSWVNGDDFESYWNQAATVGGSDNVLERFLMPGQAQKQEWAQQMTSQMYQNEWNSEIAKMNRMKKAGINPHVAAAGIAGSSSSPSVSSPPSADSSGAAGVGAIAQGVQGVASAVDSGVNAYEKLSLIPVEKEKLSAETVSLLEAAGLSHWEAKAIEVMLPDRQKNLQADTYLKIANYRNTCEEYHNIVLEHDKRKAEIDEIEKEASLLKKQGNLVDAQKLKVQAETDGISLDNWWKETNKTFWETHGYRADDPMDVALRNAAANGKTEAAEAVGNAIEKYSYDERKGFNQAEIEDAWSKAFNTLKGQYDVDVMYADFSNWSEASKAALVKLAETLVPEGGNLETTLGNIIAAFFNKDTGSKANSNKPVAPKSGPIY